MGVIAARNLTRQFGTHTVVEGVSLDVAAGEIVALLGPNGAGKTTTLRLLAGLIAPTNGEVWLGGARLTPHSGSLLRRRVGFLPEAPGLWDRLTVRENLAIYGDIYGVPNAEHAIDALLETFDVRSHATARAAELSKGMRQKVAICRTLLHDPEILLLDEPTSGLDPESSKTVRQVLEARRARGCAILLSTHNLPEAERQADRIAVLRTRVIAVDAPAALRRLASARLVVRTTGDASRWLTIARSLDPAAEAAGSLLVLTALDLERDTPRVVRALVAAGAPIVEVRHELPALEDVYLLLLDTRSAPDPQRLQTRVQLPRAVGNTAHMGGGDGV